MGGGLTLARCFGCLISNAGVRKQGLLQQADPSLSWLGWQTCPSHIALHWEAASQGQAASNDVIPPSAMGEEVQICRALGSLPWVPALGPLTSDIICTKGACQNADFQGQTWERPLTLTPEPLSCINPNADKVREEPIPGAGGTAEPHPCLCSPSLGDLPWDVRPGIHHKAGPVCEQAEGSDKSCRKALCSVQFVPEPCILPEGQVAEKVF